MMMRHKEKAIKSNQNVAMNRPYRSVFDALAANR
jgi:hypothetical protein